MSKMQPIAYHSKSAVLLALASPSPLLLEKFSFLSVRAMSRTEIVLTV